MKFTDRTNRPKAVVPQFDNLPEELKQAKQFVLWSYRWNVKSGSWAKMPLTLEGKGASTTDLNTWSTFEECRTALFKDTQFDGIGFVFSKDSPYIGVDIDNCITDGKLSPVADEIVSQMQSYTELSPSRTGLHIIGRAGYVPAAKGTWRGLDVEVYHDSRYFTMTGQLWGSSYSDVEEIGKRASELAMLIKQEAVAKSAIASQDRQLARALKDPYIKALFDGDMSEYDNDQSRADLALCSKLASYAGGDQAALDRMFRQSKLFRDKWDERHGADTYGNLTMVKALEGSRVQLVTGPGRGGLTLESSKQTRAARRFTVDSMWDKVMDFRESGGARGFHPGWDQLEKFYRPTLGSLTVMVGVPSSGKSTWIDCLVYNMAKRHGWRTTLASFESLPIERHINSLCQIHLQKPTYTFIPGYASDKEMDEARKALNDWFYFIMPDDDELTTDSILSYVQDDIDDHGIKGFVLDPFTEVDLQSNGKAEVENIKNDLKKIQTFTRSRELHTWLLAHPTKSIETYKQEELGMRPTLYSAAGAAHFRNKADFGLVIHRWQDDTVNLYIDKVRNAETAGGVGKVQYKYHSERREYQEVNDTW